MAENEFSSAFSTAFDAGVTVNICYPSTTDWSCESDEWVEALPPAVKARAEALAWTTLQALTGYRLAICATTVRPCARRCMDAARTWMEAPINGSGPFSPSINSAGLWINSCGCKTQDCSCTELSVVKLIGPVGQVVEVLLDGAVVDPSLYRVDNGNELVSLGDPWPACQNMEADPAEGLGGFSVKYFMGFAPDILADFAAGLLAAEYAKACIGDSCALPSNVIAITRQGVTMEVQAGSFPNGYTGIQGVDAYILGINPNGLRKPSSIASPDYRPNRMTTIPNG